MRIPKEIIREGTHAYVNKDGATQFLTATPDLIQYWHDSGNAMRAAGLPIPIPLEHDTSAHPMTPAERLLNNAGEVENFFISDVEQDGKKIKALFSNNDIRDEKVRGKINEGTIKWTSPWFTSFVDGTGKPWKSVIGHLALTSRPVLHKQHPFSAAFSLTPTTRTPADLPEGFCLSRAGLLSELQPGTFKPAYPVAFSLWTGAKFAFPEEMKKKEGEEKPKEGGEKKPEGKDGEKPPDGEEDGKKPFGKEGGESKPRFDPMTGQPIKESLVDPDGDINVWCVIADMASMALGVDIGDEEINAENGPEKLLEILRNAVRDKIAKSDMGTQNNEPPPATPPSAGNPKPKNPVLQEQQPMFMSLTREQAEALPDAKDRSIALSLVAARERAEAAEKKQKAMEQKLFNDAKALRDKRISNLTRGWEEVDRAALQQIADGAQFSLADTGVVADPIEPWIKAMEKQQNLLPALLRVHGGEFSVKPQPEETTGGIPAEQMKKVRDDLMKAGGFIQ